MDVIVENEKIRVTLSAELFAQYRSGCRDRTEVMRSGDRRVHSAEATARGKVLSDAMRALAHRQVVAGPVKLDMAAAREQVFDGYVFEYLSEHGRYDPWDLIRRADAGRMLSQGQASELSDARAYASGKMGDLDNAGLVALGRKILDSKNPDDRREWRRLALMSNRHADPAVAEKIIEVAREEAQRTLDYSKHYTAGQLGIEVLRPDIMPKQIGLQTYDKTASEHDLE